MGSPISPAVHYPVKPAARGTVGQFCPVGGEGTLDTPIAEDDSRQGRQHIVVMTVRIRHALDPRDALAAVLGGGGELVGAVVTGGLDSGYDDPGSLGTLEGSASLLRNAGQAW